ncbi:MAG TPA: gamma-glutamyltransferase, partial [Candidatus Binatia bacterium]|nr:gamma-glutamyltransferase [Candidatus Binatia bacterium]
MKIKKIAACTLSVVAVAGALGAGIYHALTRDPTPITIDPKLYDDYAGYYDFGNGYVITVHRDGNRLMSDVPGLLSRELFPETESRFFVKGQPLRIIFHRNDTGRVDSVIAQWKKGQETAERIPALLPNAEFTNAIIAATTGGKAVEAGMEILKEGGTAADAAMAIAVCEVVHAGGSYVSFAGPLMMMYYDASGGKVFYLDAQYNTPIEEKNAGSIPRKGGRTALVPGFTAGVQAAHDRFGKVPFKRLFDRAIAMAENGEVVGPVMEWWINSKKGVLSRSPETKRIFTRADGKFYAKGDLFRQTELAGTLKKVAAQSAAYMYEGDWGRKFAEVVQKNGGKITREDMK